MHVTIHVLRLVKAAVAVNVFTRADRDHLEHLAGYDDYHRAALVPARVFQACGDVREHVIAVGQPRDPVIGFQERDRPFPEVDRHVRILLYRVKVLAQVHESFIRARAHRPVRGIDELVRLAGLVVYHLVYFAAHFHAFFGKLHCPGDSAVFAAVQPAAYPDGILTGALVHRAGRNVRERE